MEKAELLEQLKEKVRIGVEQLQASVDHCVELEAAFRDMLMKKGLGDDALPASLNPKEFYSPLPIEHCVPTPEFDADDMPDDASIELQLEEHLRRWIHWLPAPVLTLPLPSPLPLPPSPTTTPTLTLTLTLTLYPNPDPQPQP